MKVYSLYITLFFSSMLLFSCKKSELITFEGERSLYFAITSTDSIRVDFSMLSNEVKDSTLKISVRLLGMPLDATAAFDIAIDDKITTAAKGSDFEMSTAFSFQPQQYSVTVPVKINRTAALEKGEFVLGLELKSNQQFNPMLYDRNVAKNQARKIRIFMTALLKPTPNWANKPGVFGTEYYLGRFTKKKIQLLAVLDRWTFSQVYRFVDRDASIYGNMLNNYLMAQKAAGTPILEDDGTLMDVGQHYK